MACLALVLSLGSSAYAAAAIAPGSVGTRQLRDSAVTNEKLAGGAVTANKVKPDSLLSRDFAPGQLPAGRAGATGPQGPAGTTGPQGPAGISGYQVNTSTSPTSATSSKAVAVVYAIGANVK